MAVEGDESSYYKYTQEWIRSIGRGGLFHVNDATFLFFCAVEIQTQHHLPSHLRQSTDHLKSKESLIQAISSDKDVLSTWNTLAVDISDENQANELLNLLIEQWITIRGFSLTATWLEQYKKASKQSTKKWKALRKEVARKSKRSSYIVDALASPLATPTQLYIFLCSAYYVCLFFGTMNHYPCQQLS